MRILKMPQGSAAWWEARRGLPTASDFDKIVTPVRGEFSRQSVKYIDQLIADTVSLSPTWFSDRGGKPPNTAIENGVLRENESRKWYSLHHDADVQEVGLCLSDCERYGMSPDGLIGSDGILELKNPMAKTHSGYLREGGLPPAYRCQVHGQLLVSGRSFVHFVSYAPPLPPLVVEVVPDDFTKRLGEAVLEFVEKLAAARKKMGVAQVFHCPDCGQVLQRRGCDECAVLKFPKTRTTPRMAEEQ